MSVPADASPGPASVQFMRADGAVSQHLGFTVVVGGPKVSSVNPERVVLEDNPQRITIFGLSFGAPDPRIDPPQNRVNLGGVSLEVLDDGWTAERIVALVPALAAAKKHGLMGPGQAAARPPLHKGLRTPRGCRRCRSRQHRASALA